MASPFHNSACFHRLCARRQGRRSFLAGFGDRNSACAGTERGRIACDAVLLAGGAWSSLFLKRHGIAFPQLSMLSSVMRTTAGPEVFPGGIWGPEFCMRRRNDGKYTLSRGDGKTVYLVPDTFRWIGKFWNAYLAERKKMKLSIDGRFFRELIQNTRWPLDAESPFERMRILDPPPDLKLLYEALAGLKERFPALKDLQAEESWAGMIDVTPDSVPCITPLDSLPGLILASGFSGHGFGIGPGAGKLAAELVSGASPCVDPAPFRHSRFSTARASPPSNCKFSLPRRWPATAHPSLDPTDERPGQSMLFDFRCNDPSRRHDA